MRYALIHDDGDFGYSFLGWTDQPEWWLDVNLQHVPRSGRLYICELSKVLRIDATLSFVDVTSEN